MSRTFPPFTMGSTDPLARPDESPRHRVTLRGFWLAFWFRNSTPKQQRALFGEIAMLITTGALAASVQETFPLSRIKDAVAAAASGGRRGKILLVP